MISFGIMQGRLTPSKGRGIQFFPFGNWKEEFRIGKELGIDEIEWIIDYHRYRENPFWNENGIYEVRQICAETRVRVRSVCFDYFMRRPFFKCEGNASELRSENLCFAHTVLNAMDKIGASLLEIPLVDGSSMKTPREEEALIAFVREVLNMARPLGIAIGLESDLPPVKFTQFLDRIGDRNIYANYDSGNSSGLGYAHDAEIHSLGRYVANVHIKDRVFHGMSVELGTGDADFDLVFGALRDIGYSGSIILQAARGEDGKEIENIQKQLHFVNKYCRKYSIG